MSPSIKKLWNDYGVGAVIILLIVAYGATVLANYLTGKGSSGAEYMDQNRNPAYQNSNYTQPKMNSSGGVKPSEPLGQNEVFASVNGIQSSQPGIPTSCAHPNIQNPSELLPKDANNQWAQLNPSGKGELANVNLLRAGYNIGIDTIGQSLRNANLQIRSEPPNPQLYTGPWNISTITPDFMRPPLEIGAGIQ
jgi:hypothetical protein